MGDVSLRHRPVKDEKLQKQKKTMIVITIAFVIQE